MLKVSQFQGETSDLHLESINCTSYVQHVLYMLQVKFQVLNLGYQLKVLNFVV